MTHQTNPEGQPLLWKAAIVAKALGVSKRLLIADAESGRLPLRLVRFGASGVAHIHREDALAFMRNISVKEQR